MEKLGFYSVTFGIPLLLYVLWLVRLQKQCPFLGLLIIAVVAVWITLWPVYYAPEHRRATDEMIDDRADAVINGFVLMGWINGLIGCLPIIVIEVPRSIVLLMRKRHAKQMPKQHIEEGEQTAHGDAEEAV